MNNLEIAQLKPGIWALDDGMICCYLFAGKRQALLLDTGFGEIRIDKAVRELTALPVFVVNTHSHPDHIMGNKYFSKIYVHPLGMARIKHASVLPVTEGMIFDLGSLSLRVVELPGHTPDGIGLMDYSSGMIFTGDVVENENCTVRSLPGYVLSMKKLLALKDKIKNIYPSHGKHPVGMNQVLHISEALKALESGSLTGELKHIVMPPDIDVYTYEYKYGDITMSYNPAIGDWA